MRAFWSGRLAKAVVSSPAASLPFLGATQLARIPSSVASAAASSTSPRPFRMAMSVRSGIPSVVEVEVPCIGIGDGNGEVDPAGRVFPIRRVYCVAKNYAAHVVEMGGDPKRDPPCFFSKPADAVCTLDAIPYPPKTKNLHYEIEQVVAIGSRGRDIPLASALDYVWGYGVGVDLTRRDIQSGLKQSGRPWELAKAFDHSAPVSLLVPADLVDDPLRGEIGLKVNGVVKQRSNLSKHTWNVKETIAYLSGFVELFPGDLIFMGTPEGVGPIEVGDTVEGWIEGTGKVRFEVTK